MTDLPRIMSSDTHETLAVGEPESTGGKPLFEQSAVIEGKRERFDAPMRKGKIADTWQEGCRASTGCGCREEEA
jgi:hypothetical protein